MKHCYFALVYNELPFLIQKLPFLYEHFDQIILYDLGIFHNPYTFSNDGSHEYIKNFPDPENKLTLIEKTDLSDVPVLPGVEMESKRKMSVVGSQMVRDDIDVFWTMDIDEFFDAEMIPAVEQLLEKNPDVQIVDIPQYLFWRDLDHILCEPASNLLKNEIRVARHQPGRIYLHCNMDKIGKSIKLLDFAMYHFSWISAEKIIFKSEIYSIKDKEMKNHYINYLQNVWLKTNLESIPPNCLYGYPNMHPNPFLKAGVKKFPGLLPKYIDKHKVMQMLHDKDIQLI